MKYGPRYTELTKAVEGSGREAVGYLPKELQKLVNQTVKMMPERDVPSGRLDWRVARELIKGHTASKDLMKADLYGALQMQHLRSSKRMTPELKKGLDLDINIKNGQAKINAMPGAGFGEGEMFSKKNMVLLVVAAAALFYFRSMR